MVFQEAGHRDQNVSGLLGTEQTNLLVEQVLVLVAAAYMDPLWWDEEFLGAGRKDQQLAEEYLEAGSKGPEKLAWEWAQTEGRNHPAVALSVADGQKAPLLQGGE